MVHRPNIIVLLQYSEVFIQVEHMKSVTPHHNHFEPHAWVAVPHLFLLHLTILEPALLRCRWHALLAISPSPTRRYPPLIMPAGQGATVPDCSL